MNRRFTRAGRAMTALGLTTVLTVGGSLTSGFIAQADQAQADQAQGDRVVTDATFQWGMNHEANNGAYFGGCNYFVAGKIPNTNSSSLLTQAICDGATDAGNATVTKPDANGVYSAADWSNKCLSSNGTALKSGTKADANDYGNNRVEISDGTGWVDTETGAAQISWQGSWTVVFYSGLTYWYVSDPVLTVDAAGTATVTATASGYGADMYDTSKWTEIAPQTITLADLGDATSDTVNATSTALTETGRDDGTVQPAYLGVAIDTGEGTAQSTTGSSWGSFPQSFVDFQTLTGQSAYWYSSGGLADGAKVATPLTVSYTSQQRGVAPAVTAQPVDAAVIAGADATFALEVSGDPAPTVQWQSKSGDADWADVAGATGATLTVSQATAAQNGTQYRAVVTNTQGGVTSEAATLTVSEVPTEEALTSETQGDITASDTELGQGGTLTLSLGAEHANEQVHVYVYSEPRDLGVYTADANGAVTLQLPTDLAVGEHKIAALASDGTLIGWESIEVVEQAAAASDGEQTAQGGAVASVDGADADSAVLAQTGEGIAAGIVGLGAVLAGAVLMLVRRSNAAE